jgi:hypothetical protein
LGKALVLRQDEADLLEGLDERRRLGRLLRVQDILAILFFNHLRIS